MLLTLVAQQVRVEADEVGAEVDPALVRNSSSPVAAGEIRHQLLSLRQTEQTLKNELLHGWGLLIG